VVGVQTVDPSVHVIGFDQEAGFDLGITASAILSASISVSIIGAGWVMGGR